MPTKNPFLRKLRDIRYNYGKAADTHFRTCSVCDVCGEERIVCLAVHHVEGKEKDIFQTLCHNCHAIKHATYTETYTYKDFLKYLADKATVSKKQIVTLQESESPAIISISGQSNSPA